MAYLHERGVKGFVALNVLIFDEELPAVEAQLRHVASCGVDAVIVQVGLVPLCMHATYCIGLVQLFSCLCHARLWQSGLHTHLLRFPYCGTSHAHLDCL